MHLERIDSTTGVVEVGQPTQCANGHPFGPCQVIVGYLPCLCLWPERGHREFVCRECYAVLYVAEHDGSALPPPR